jgi:hypothetical protein
MFSLNVAKVNLVLHMFQWDTSVAVAACSYWARLHARGCRGDTSRKPCDAGHGAARAHVKQARGADVWTSGPANSLLDHRRKRPNGPDVQACKLPPGPQVKEAQRPTSDMGISIFSPFFRNLEASAVRHLWRAALVFLFLRFASSNFKSHESRANQNLAWKK